MKIVLTFVFAFLIVFSVYGKRVVKKHKSKPAHTHSTEITQAESKTDSVNIRQLVADQIEQARKKQITMESLPKVAVSPAISTGNYETVKKYLNNMPGYLNASFDMVMEISLMGIISILAALLIFLIRGHHKKRIKTRKTLKDNIKLLREEKLFVKNNPRLSKIRNELGKSPATYNYSKEKISNAAKDWNISKGEILLAAKIKAHELNRQWPNKH